MNIGRGERVWMLELNLNAMRVGSLSMVVEMHCNAGEMLIVVLLDVWCEV